MRREKKNAPDENKDADAGKEDEEEEVEDGVREKSG